jgi:hypothetical protein
MLSPHTIKAMSDAADVVIGDVLLRGSSGMQTAPRTEVGLVAAVTLGGIDRVASAWRPILSKSNFALSLTGVFCHAAPMVRFGRSGKLLQTCELADLLVVVDFQHKGALARTASLIQAKMAAKAQRVTLTGPSSKRQLDLYQSWPPFLFVDAIYGTNQYALMNPTGEQSGTFGVIDRHFKKQTTAPPIWTQHRASPTPSIATSEPMLGTFIANMAAPGAYGRPAWPGGKDDWSKVVDLLLSVTYRKAFRHKPTLGARGPGRGVTALACFLSAGAAGSRSHSRAGAGWWPPFDGFQESDDPSPGGISLLHIQIDRPEPS